MNENNERCIRIAGTKSKKLSPDTAEITVYLTETLESYKKAEEAASAAYEELVSCLKDNGIPAEKILTSNYSIDKQSQLIFDKKGISKEVFKGYAYTHTVKCTLDSDGKLLIKLGKDIKSLKNTPRFNVSYKVSDQEKIKDELIREAVADCKRKAAISAEAAGCRLGQLLSIELSFNDSEINDGFNLFSDMHSSRIMPPIPPRPIPPRPVPMMRASSQADTLMPGNPPPPPTADPTMLESDLMIPAPKEITVNQTVITVWGIE